MPNEIQLNFATAPQIQRVTPEVPTETVNTVGQGEKAIAAGLSEALNNVTGQINLQKQEGAQAQQVLNEGIEALQKERRLGQLDDREKIKTKFQAETSKIYGEILTDPNLNYKQHNDEFQKRTQVLREQYQSELSGLDRDLAVDAIEKIEKHTAELGVRLRLKSAETGIEVNKGDFYGRIEKEKGIIARSREDLVGKQQTIASYYQEIQQKLEAGVFNAQEAERAKAKVQDSVLISSFVGLSRENPDQALALAQASGIDAIEQDPALKKTITNAINADIQEQRRQRREDREDEKNKLEDKSREALDANKNELIITDEKTAQKAKAKLDELYKSGHITKEVYNREVSIAESRIDNYHTRARRAITEPREDAADARARTSFGQSQTEYNQKQKEREQKERLEKDVADLAAGVYNSLATGAEDDVKKFQETLRKQRRSESDINRLTPLFAQKREALNDPLQQGFVKQQEKLSADAAALFRNPTAEEEQSNPGKTLAVATARNAINFALQQEILQAKKEGRTPDLQGVYQRTLVAHAPALTKTTDKPYDVSHFLGGNFRTPQDIRDYYAKTGNTSPEAQSHIAAADEAFKTANILNGAAKANIEQEQQELEKKAEEAKTRPTPTPALSPSGFASPLEGSLTPTPNGKYGDIGNRDHTHKGTDYARPQGSLVKSSAGGEVVFAGELGGYGNLVRIKHPDGTETRYGHLHSIDVKVGDKVGQGVKIGTVGNTGTSTGPHLHFEIRDKNGNALDPHATINRSTTPTTVNPPPSQGFLSNPLKIFTLALKSENRSGNILQPSTIPGGTAIGKYQFAGELEQGLVLDALKRSSDADMRELGRQLDAAGKPGSKEFRQAWATLFKQQEVNVNPIVHERYKKFEAVQDAVAYDTYIKPLESYMKFKDDKGKETPRADITQQAIAAASLQLGPIPVKKILLENNKASDFEVITKLYEARLANPNVIRLGATGNVQREFDTVKSYFTSAAGYVPFTSSREAQKTQKAQETPSGTTSLDVIQKSLKTLNERRKSLEKSP